MRLGTCIALELAVVAGAATGVCFGVGQAMRVAGEYVGAREAQAAIIAAAVTRLKDDRFAVWVVGDVRDDRGFYVNLQGRTVEAFEAAGATFAQIHTSGHASRDDLEEFARSIAPRRLVPIHSFTWDEHLDGFENVQRLRDGEPFTIP